MRRRGYLSDSQRAADDKVAKAEGFVDTLGAALQNPRAILGTVAQSAPGMVAGMGVQAGVARAIAARAALATTEGAAASAAQLAAGKGAAEATKAALATTTGKAAATKAVDAAGTRLIALGAATEGAQSAGQIADGAQAKGRDYTDYALPALAAGVGTAAISLGAGKLMGDSATQIATGAQSAGVKGSVLKRAGKEALSEGVLEEMPQSAQEQIFTNIANGEQDIAQGVGNAAATGMLAGGAMGAGLGMIQRHAPPPLPNSGPLSQAANAGQAAAAAQANATAPQDAPAPPAVPAPEVPALSLEQIDARMAQLVAIGRGQLGGRTQAPDGSMVKTLAVQPRPLTAEETAEFETLKQARIERTSIPADQQAEFQAALAAEQDEHNRKHQATMQAAAAARSEAEDRQIAHLVAQDEERTRAAEAAAQQKTLAAELAAQEAAIAESDARVEQGRRERAIANRLALRDRIANDHAIARDQKTASFRAALAADGYTDTLVTAEDRAWFKEATAPLPSAPNELIDAVPERQAPPRMPKATNTRAVDDAIAAGMRLKTANGKVLHKPGSSKVFTLSTEQRAYYLAAMARAEAAETPQQTTDSVIPAVQAQVDGANSVPDAVNATLALAAPNDLAAPAPAPVTAFDQAAHGAATSPHNDLAEPSAAQKEAGNYKLGKSTMQGLPLSIENPVGSTRRGVDEDGTPWETIMAHHYGYIRGTKGADKDHIDTFIGPNQASDKVFVIDQVSPATGKFDEHKVMLGFDTATEAQAAYKANYADDWRGGDNITSTTMKGFKDWLASGKTTRPFAKAQERSAAPTADDIAARALLKATPEPAATAFAAPVEPAPAVAAPLTRQQLYRMTVKDMSDTQLLQARDVLADSPRAPKIEKEIKARGLTAAPAIEPQADATNATVPEEGQPIPASDVPTDEDPTDPDPAPPTKPRTTKDGESAPAQRAAPNLPDLKTYSAAEAKVEWDGARAGKRGMFLGRIDQRETDIVEKNWDEMAPAERDLIHHALNEDFYSPAWFINTNGERIDRVAMPEVPVKSAETVEQEAGAQRWAQTEPRERHFALLGAGVGADADQGQYVDWDKLGPDVRKRVAANFAANPLERIERDKIASRYAALLARDGVSDAPTDFHRKFADQLMAKDAYALKWVTNGMNDKAKKVFSEFTGVKLPKAQGASWEAIKQWGGITPEQDAAHAAAVESANQAKRDEEDAAAAERAVESQRFRVSATDGTVSRPLKVTFVTEDKKTATDVEATTAANEAAKKIKDKFRSWVWTDAERASELVESYINGAMWLDPQFWRDLARADRSLFRKVAYKFMELASKAVNAMRSARFDVAQLVTDVAAVRAIMVDTWAQHAQRQGRDGAAPGAPAFSGIGDAQSSLAAARDASRQFAEAELQYGGRAAYDALKADGGTFLSYPQWIMTKTANFKQFYGDWEAGNGQSDSGSIPGREQGSGDARGLYSGADVAAGSSPTFPGQSGPIRAVGSDAESSSVEPVVYYHGSRDDITEFDLDHPGRKDNGWLGTGVYGTSDDFVAASYASIKKGDQNPNIMPMFMAVKNPFVATPQLKNRLRLASREKINEFTADLAARGFDGVVLKFNDGSQELVAFNPAAVKSAIGNNGGFDTGSADLRYSRTNQTDSPEFKAWFGKSKMVASDGAPMVLYHATKSDFSAFDPSGVGAFGRGIYLSGMPSRLTQYWGGFGKLGERHGPNGGNIMPVYVKLENPAELQQADAIVPTDKESRNKFTALQQRMIRAGHDGMVSMLGGKVWEAVVFSPEQIKSAIGNNGDFDPSNDDIRFSRANLGETLANAANSMAAVRLPAGYLVGDLFNKSGKISWWHKTIGTMENMARRHPLFAPVYEAVQSFLGDVSRFGVVAADKAPTLLPKLENVADVIGKNRKKALTAADTKAIGAPIFEGTLTWARDAHGEPVKVADLEAQAEQLSSAQKAQILINKGIIDDAQNRAWQASPLDFYDNVINKKFGETQLAAGVVWSDAELRSLFQLNDYQIGLYHEFRAALDKSLTNLTITEMVKLGGKDANGTLEQALAAPDLAAAALLLRDHFVELARMHPQQADMHLDTAKQVMDLGDKGINLMARGYAPLSRFGKYTVYVEQGGEQVYFGMFETQYEASRMARQMRTDHPDAEVSHGTVSEDAFKLFAGVSPETIELFGSMIGLDSQADAASTEVYQAYLKLAKNNRSAMKRMIQRKGIAGFSEDAGRVLAGFIYSNARLSAGNAHLGEMDEAITAIPKQQGELTDAAVQLRESIRNPQPGNRLGGLMFAQFLGGSVASAMVNLTQPLTMTLPFLSQYGGLAAASKQITAAVRDAGKDSTGEAHLDQALQWATDEGIVAPQEIHFLQAQAAGKGALMAGDGTRAGDARAMLNNTMSKVQLGWGKMFAMAEMANRRVTFIAAYRTAIAQNIPNPEKFAAATVSQTQGTYNSGNKPRWARNAIGGLLMTFKQYSIGYLELLTRMASAGEKGSKERAAGQRGALYMIAVLFLMAGADGLPFEQDIEDAIDGALQRLGYNFSTKRAKQEFLTGVLGEGGADFALKGISSMPGMPIDVAGRFGMGNLIPGTGMLTKKDSYTQDLGELAGPAGDVAKRAFSATGRALGGDVGGAFLEFSPAAVRNAAKGIDMLASGAYKDTRGYKVNDVSPMEGVMKTIGFQPNSTANIQDAKGQALNMIGQNRMRSSEIQEHWAQGIASGKPEVVAEARAWRDDWNAKNPETPIRVNLPAIYRRVRSMRQDAVNRTQKTAPAALKATVRGELSDLRG